MKNLYEVCEKHNVVLKKDEVKKDDYGRCRHWYSIKLPIGGNPVFEFCVCVNEYENPNNEMLVDRFGAFADNLWGSFFEGEDCGYFPSFMNVCNRNATKQIMNSLGISDYVEKLEAKVNEVCCLLKTIYVEAAGKQRLEFHSDAYDD